MTQVFQPKKAIRPIATAIAWAISTAIALVLTNGAIEFTNSSYDVWIVFIGSPFLLGFMQWLVLRRFLPKGWWWVLLTMVGCGLGWLSALGIFFAMGSLADLLPFAWSSWFPEEMMCGFIAAAGGFGIGLAQWLYLRRHLKRTVWWLLASAIALAIGGGPNLCAGFATYSSHNWPLTLAVGGMAGGLIKGGTFAWLLRGPRTIKI